MLKQIDSFVFNGFEISEITQVFGSPISRNAEDIVRDYKSSKLNDFLAREACSSVGNYLICDYKNKIVITSPGYCGGYFYNDETKSVAATTLGDILKYLNGEVEFDDYGLTFFLNYAPKSAFNQLPFTTMFKNVTRLPPCSLLNIWSGNREFYSYLFSPKEIDRPKSFEAALDQTTSSLARYYDAKGTPPALLFSGGADSLVIYLSLKDKLKSGAIRSIVVDHSSSNGPDRAVPVAEKIGMKLQHLRDEYIESERSHEIIATMMRRDIVSGRGPSVALFDHEELNGVDVLHGQNMDAISKINMTVLPRNLERPYLSKTKVIEAKTDALELEQYRTFLTNLQFTDAYANDELFQRLTSSFYVKMHKGTVADPKPGTEGFLRGLLSSQCPNILPKIKFPNMQISALDKEVKTFLKYAGEDAKGKSRQMFLARYLTYAALANKRLSTLPFPNGSRTIFVAMSGPILAYFGSKKRKLSLASSPKGEIYTLIRKLSGTPYSALARRTLPAFEGRKVSSDKEDLLLKPNMELLDAEKSMVLERIASPAIKKHIRAIYEDVQVSCHPSSPNVSLFKQSLARNLVNLELMLRYSTRTVQSEAA